MTSVMRILMGVVLLCLIHINARHVENNEFEETPDVEGETDLTNRMRDHELQRRHRRRSRQMFGPDYSSYYYPDYRRDYSPQRQEEYYSHILRSLDEIITYLKTPPQPPQPVFIPYPVVQQRPCICKACQVPSNTNNETIPDFNDRTNIPLNDPRNWGLIQELPDLEEDDTDGARPINLIPAEPKRPTSRPAPAVEHGSSQAGNEQTTNAPAVTRPGPCGAAILTCCSLPKKSEIPNCFQRYKCVKTFATNRACSPSVVKQVLEQFKKAYAPVRDY